MGQAVSFCFGRTLQGQESVGHREVTGVGAVKEAGDKEVRGKKGPFFVGAEQEATWAEQEEPRT